MVQKDNQRVRRTKHLLASALTDMLSEMPIQDVSIVELCERAGINRTTFYYHYENQYDLLNDISGIFLDSVSQRLASGEPDSMENIHARITMVLTYMEEHLQLSRLLLNNMLGLGFIHRINSLPEIQELLNVHRKNAADPERQKAAEIFAVSGSYQLLQLWINDDHRKSASEEASLLLEMTGRVINQ